jgi:oxaloacetate decarboxylase alpha subunit
MSNEVRFIDTTLRDGNQSLWALNMKIGAMLPAAEYMDHAGFESMEFFLSVMFKKSCASIKKSGSVRKYEKIRRTRLRYHGGMHSAFEKTPCIPKLLVERLISRSHLTHIQSWNDYGLQGRNR